MGMINLHQSKYCSQLGFQPSCLSPSLPSQKFLNMERNRLPPIYNLEDEMEYTEIIINDIAGMEYFRIYFLDKLFQHFYSTTFPEHPVPQPVVRDILTLCDFDYHPNLACEWHINYEKDAGKNCSFSCAHRWIFMMCKNMDLADTFGVEPREDKHFPRALPFCGVTVDVPQSTFKEEYNERTRKSTEKKFFDDGTDSDDDLCFFFTHSSRKKELLTSRSLDRAESSWRRKDVAFATGASSSRACSTTSLNMSSSEDFPTLGARAAHKGRGQNFQWSK